MAEIRKAPRRTRRIVIQQEAIRTFVAQLPAKRRQLALEIDLVDAALLDHVGQRLAVRKHQKIELHVGVPVVWVHFGTVAAENWLLQLGQDAISRRFTKLVRAGFLVRKKVPRGPKGGSRSYFGLSQSWRGALEGQETARPEKADTDQKRPHSEAAFDPGRYGADEKRLQSLGVSPGASQCRARGATRRVRRVFGGPVDPADPFKPLDGVEAEAAG